MQFIIVLLVLFALNVLCFDFDNKNRDHLKENLINETTDDYKDYYDFIEKNIEESSNEKKNLTNNYDNSTELNISFNDRMKDIFQSMTENIIPVENKIKQRFNEFLLSLELPADCLASYARIINAMQKSELWAFKCKLCLI